MLRTSINNSGITRTLNVLYSTGVAWATTLHAKWDRKTDILPGRVMTRINDEVVAPLGAKFGGISDVTMQEPFGLASLFVAPRLGIDECRSTDAFAVIVGDNSTLVRIKAPAYDLDGNWTVPTDGSKKLLYTTDDAHKQGAGYLTTTKGIAAPHNIPVATLISVDKASQSIVVSLIDDVKTA